MMPLSVRATPLSEVRTLQNRARRIAAIPSSHLLDHRIELLRATDTSSSDQHPSTLLTARVIDRSI